MQEQKNSGEAESANLHFSLFRQRNCKLVLSASHTATSKCCQGERRMSIVERRLHDWKEMWVLNINRKLAPIKSAPYSADLRWRVIWFLMLSRGQLAVRFCNHLSIIQSHHAWKMRFNYPGIKLNPALGTWQNWTFVIICSRRSHDCKKGHFTS